MEEATTSTTADVESMLSTIITTLQRRSSAERDETLIAVLTGVSAVITAYQQQMIIYRRYRLFLFRLLCALYSRRCIKSGKETSENAVIGSRKVRSQTSGDRVASVPVPIVSAIGQRRIRPPYCIRRRNALLELLTSTATNGDDAFRIQFRMSRDAFRNLLKVVGPQKRHGWEVETELLIFLRYLAQGCTFGLVASAFRIPVSSVAHMVNRRLHQLLDRLKCIIQLPQADEIEEIGHGFAVMAENSAFRFAAGSLDSCHVKIRAPTKYRADYLNHYNYYSIQLQALTDHRGCFIDVFTGFPGSVVDSAVLRWSPLCREASYPPPDYFIVGSASYPSLQKPLPIVTPFSDRSRTLSASEFAFNECHRKVRSVSHRSFLDMRRRWQLIFGQERPLSYKKAPKVVSVCAMLHNICMQSGDTFGLPEDQIADSDDSCAADDGALEIGETCGSQLQNNIAEQVLLEIQQSNLDLNSTITIDS